MTIASTPAAATSVAPAAAVWAGPPRDAAAVVARYATAAPRYTSYPTAPHFAADFDRAAVEAAWAAADGPLGLYLHVPFCEKRCLYCGCHVEIARERSLGATYVDDLLRELAVVAALTPRRSDRPLQLVALGGGTPTWLAPADLARLMAGIRAELGEGPAAEWSIEIDPRTIDADEAAALPALGFNRFSLGVQDLDVGVQKAIGRPQAATRVAEVAAALLRPGTSLNFDLMYGLPDQTEASLRQTVRHAIAMGPSRFAVFGYAHVPWMRPHQRGLERHGLPDDAARLELMLAAREELLGAGFVAIGNDHYARADDPLAVAAAEGRLGRNFMGYTDQDEVDLLAVGVSAIASVGRAFTANLRDRRPWHEAIGQGRAPWERALVRSDDDVRRGWVIRSWMCQLGVSRAAFAARFGVEFDATFAPELAALQTFVDDELVADDGDRLHAVGLGWLVVRNVAAVFDAWIARGAARYSRTV